MNTLKNFQPKAIANVTEASRWLLVLSIFLMQLFFCDRLYKHNEELEVFSRSIIKSCKESETEHMVTRDQLNVLKKDLFESRYLLAQIWNNSSFLIYDRLISSQIEDKCIDDSYFKDINELVKNHREKLTCPIFDAVYGEIKGDLENG